MRGDLLGSSSKENELGAPGDSRVAMCNELLEPRRQRVCWGGMEESAASRARGICLSLYSALWRPQVEN